MLFLFVFRTLVSKSLVIKRTPLDVPLVLFLASAGLSTLLAYNQNVAVFGIYSRYDGLLTILTYAALFWLGVQALRGPGDGRTLLRVLMAAGYVVAAIALVQSVSDSCSKASSYRPRGPTSLGRTPAYHLLHARHHRRAPR